MVDINSPFYKISRFIHKTLSFGWKMGVVLFLYYWLFTDDDNMAISSISVGAICFALNFINGLINHFHTKKRLEADNDDK